MRSAIAACAVVVLACAAWKTARAEESAPVKPDIVDLRQTDQSLRETYAKGKRIGLPRLVMLDSQGRLIYGQSGVTSNLRYHLHQALEKDKPLAVPITLNAVLDEVQDRDGNPVTVATLPKADAYVVDYWASWCTPCRMMERDLKGVLDDWHDARIVWIKVESDPEILPEHRRK